jgi:phosphoglucosamine mutase
VGALFGTDGVRGVFGVDLTTRLAFDLGRAVVVVLRRYEAGDPVIVIARDTRASGEPLEEALADGILSVGASVILAGIEPTPAVAFLTTELGASAGAVISASHNPADDNGIKFFGPLGFKLSDDLEDEIEGEVADPTPLDVPRGTVREAGDVAERYVQHVESSAEASLAGLRVVVDSANGAAYRCAPDVLRRLGADVISVFDEPDGTNINAGCGALHPEVVARAVVEHDADVGVAHDGDADRALFADADGNVIDGDHVLAACAVALKRERRLPNDTIVTTVMTNLGLHRAMQREGISVVQTQVGDRYVLEEMLRSGAELGGEQSGHVIFRSQATTGDGLITAVRFLSLAAKCGVSVAELASVMRRFPQVLENVRVTRHDELEDANEVWDAVRAAEAELDGSGRVLVRASGTEPLVRVMVEAETEELARRHADALAERVRRALG